MIADSAPSARAMLGWQALFAVNVPLALLALVVVHRAAPADAGRETGKLSTLIRDSDIPGILAFVTSLMLAMMALLNVMPGYRWCIWCSSFQRRLLLCVLRPAAAAAGGGALRRRAGGPADVPLGGDVRAGHAGDSPAD
jgi:hypothetical protein